MVVVLACIPDKVSIEGGSEDNSTAMPQYQRSRQFKLRVVLYSVCDDENLLRPTTVQWTFEPQARLTSTNKELIVISNSLEYGIYTVNVVIVSVLLSSLSVSVLCSLPSDELPLLGMSEKHSNFFQNMRIIASRNMWQEYAELGRDCIFTLI